MTHKHQQHPDWEAVIGLEIHVELNTHSKLFSHAPNHFGDEPNRNITEVCTGQPGALPVLNREAVNKAILFGCAIQGEVARFSRFDRKSYFYPDSPRNFQITQYDYPIVRGGTVVAEVHGQEHSFAINRVHLEDDAGMLKHFPKYALVDYNRAGCPLIEIVSEPCIHSADEAIAYAMMVKAILQTLDISDCNMEEGSLRIDTNVSVRKKGETTLRNKIEIKNMNSFSFMGLALKAEISRQIQAYLNHPDLPIEQVISQSTYRWDPEKKETVLMREKESADDYRYFPEPDLPPILLEQAFIEQIRATLPELPLEREQRYVRTLGLSHSQAYELVSDKQLADYFEEALKICPNARSLSNWLLVEFPGRLKEKGETVLSRQLPAAHIASLVNLIDSNKITGKIAKAVADEMVEHPSVDPAQMVASNPNYQTLQDPDLVDRLVDKVIQENLQSVTDYKNGREKAFAFLVGQVMKLCQGKADPQMVNQKLKEKISTALDGL